jgi:hypothetical protein
VVENKSAWLEAPLSASPLISGVPFTVYEATAKESTWEAVSFALMWVGSSTV